MAPKRKAHETDSESEEPHSSTKHSRTSTKQKIAVASQTFRPKHSEKYPVLQKSAKGDTFAFCSMCRCDFSLRHGGMDDCRRHMESKKHKDACATLKAERITHFFVAQKPGTSSEPSTEEVTRAETVMVSLLAELNLPFTAADKFTEAVKFMFPDSKIASKFACGRSKATAMVKKLGNGLKEELLSRMQKSPFSISTDGSNDANEKMFPLVVRTVDPDTGLVNSELLSLPFLADRATGKNIYKLIEHELEQHKIPWSHCLALGCDNANVMVGEREGVYGHMKKKHEQIFLAGCVCHLIHIAAQKGAAQLAVKIDELLVDVYYYLDKSSKRLLDLKAVQVRNDVKHTKILKHVPTRWLSLRACLPRLLENWDALKDFFKHEKSTCTDRSTTQTSRLDRLHSLFSSRTTQLYVIFLKNVLEVFDEANLALQCSEPKLHLLRRTIFKLQRSLFERFLKPVAYANKGGELLCEVQFTQAYHLKASEDLCIGDEARDFIKKKTSSGSLRQDRVNEFHADVKQFFTAASAYIIKSFPVKQKLLKHAEVVDPDLIKKNLERAAHSDSDIDMDSVKFFLDKYPSLVPPGASPDKVKQEFSRFQAHLLAQSTDLGVDDRLDQFWNTVKEIPDETGGKMFHCLPEFMQRILTIPHSSSHCERIFSCVRKNRTDVRASLGQEALEALLVLKSNPKEACQRVMDCTTEDLKGLKSCYKESLCGKKSAAE